MKLWLVDAFADGAFRGGPAYVVEPFHKWPASSWLQAMASELAQPETAFLRHRGSSYEVRWFTPTVEVSLCGHATLAALHVLVAELGITSRHVEFHYVEGRLTGARASTGYEMAFPSDVPHRIDPPDGLIDALGSEPREVWAGRHYLCAMLDNEAAVRGFRPRRDALEAVAIDHGCEPGSLIITSPADQGCDYDVVSRFFAPLFGIPEDPVTGSAHCMLMPLYHGTTGRDRLRFHQAYPGRGGNLECTIRGEEVILMGCARTIVRGELDHAAGPLPDFI